ncbi:hypothetical protein [Fibrobacter sp. UWB11]|uniref:hypothetical protein n=1 Tax=Fibrobacter sp. UWB11 TaxID=1896202 RepID=UPI00092BF91A|nr:hypothetical protein [Fibrobacter sp. UWB11]SIN82838.1 hypothetical protein SAMN05720758_0111 [Fibrobacter sp. UWB11]
MKQFVFIWLFVLLLPFYVAAKELTAIGFVEDKKAFDLDGNYIRLAFVRTDKGWFPSCDFSEGDDAGGIFKNIKSCSHKIMKQSWQVINADGNRVEAGTLEFMRRTWREIGLAKSSRSIENEIQFDSLNRSLETWKENGKRMLPLLAIPLGTNVEKIEPIAMNSSAEQKIKDKLVKQYFRKKRTICKCDYNENLISERDAKSSDVVIKPLVGYKDNVSFYEVLIPDTSGCGILDDGMELMAVKNGKVVNLTESSGMADDRPTTTAMTLFNRYVISTKKMQDTVYVFFAGGYNLDGYVLLDSELNVRGISTWNYH